MSSTTFENTSNGRFVLVYIFVILIIAIAFAIPMSREVLENNLSDLPMTQHAAQGRANTTMDADAIRRMIDNRSCHPIEFYVCPAMDQSKAICYLKPSNAGDQLWAGVIIGLQPPYKIITGYIAPYTAYWIPANTRDGCWMASRIE